MPQLPPWTPDPRTSSQVYANPQTAYFVNFPAPGQAGQFVVMALKRGPTGLSQTYLIDGGPWANDAQARQGAQAEYDKWGDQVPPDKVYHPPEPPPQPPGPPPYGLEE